MCTSIHAIANSRRVKNCAETGREMWMSICRLLIVEDGRVLELIAVGFGSSRRLRGDCGELTVLDVEDGASRICVDDDVEAEVIARLAVWSPPLVELAWEAVEVG